MGKPISRVLIDREVQASDTATFIKDLPHNVALSAIDLRFEITAGATSGTQQILDAISKIEVIDGSFNMFGAIPRCAILPQCLISGQRPPQVRNENATAVQELFVRIYFGMLLFDPDYYLDTSQFANPQVRIPIAPTISATTNATGTTTITVIVHYWNPADVPGPSKGYFRFTEVKARVPASTGTDATTLPKRFPHLGYFVYSRLAGTAIQTDQSLLEVLDDVAGLSLYKRRIEDSMSENHIDFKHEAIERGNALRQDNGTIDTDVQFAQEVVVIPVITQTTTLITPLYTLKSITGDRALLSGLQITLTASDPTGLALDTTNRQLRWEAKGRGFPNAAFIPMAEWRRPLQPYMPEPSKLPQLLVTDLAGSSQDVRTYVLELAHG